MSPIPYTTPSTISTAQLVTASLMNTEWVENIKFLANPPACRVTSTATPSLANTTWTALAFASEEFDTDSMHSTSVNTGRITINTAGVYVVSASVGIGQNATGGRAVGIRKNGAGSSGPSFGGNLVQGVGSAHPTYLTVSTVVKLAPADWIEVVVFQASGGSLAMVNSDGNHNFSAVWVGRG